MQGVAIGLVIAVGSLAMVLLTCRGLAVLAQIDDVLPRWAKEHGFCIVQRESRTYFQGPFNRYRFFRNQYRVVYYITVEDQQHTRTSAWVRVGW